MPRKAKTEPKITKSVAKRLSVQSGKPVEPNVGISIGEQIIPSETPETPHVEAPVEFTTVSDNPVLAAIQSMNANINNRLDRFEQRLTSVEQGKQVQPTHLTVPQATSTTKLDNSDEMPQYDPNLMDTIKVEGNALVKSLGLDKVGTTDRVNLGRAESKILKDIKCARCNRPPMPGQIVRVHDLNHHGEWIHEDCIGS